MKKRKKIIEGFTQVEIPTHMIDSLWLRNDNQALKIIFATGYIADFTPLEEKSIAALHSGDNYINV